MAEASLTEVVPANEPPVAPPEGAADGRVGAPPWLRRLGWALALGLVAVVLASGLHLALVRFFQLDEYVFVRAAWLVGEGQVPYRDFFEHHTPLFYLLLAPVVAAAPEGPEALLWARGFAQALLLGVFAAVFALGRRLAATAGSLLATLLLMLLPPFSARALEVRPDLLATLLFLAAGALLVGRGADRAGAAAMAGVLCAGAVLATQKALHYAWGLPALAVISLLLPPSRRPLARPWAFLAGGAVTAGVFAGWLAAVGAAEAFWQQNVELALRWQTLEGGFGVGRYLAPALLEGLPWLLAVLAGALLLVAGWWRRGRPWPPPRRWLVYLAMLVPALLSLATIPIPWPYNFLPVFAVATPLAAAGARLSVGGGGGRRVAALLAVLLLAWGASRYFAYYGSELGRDNGYQRALLTAVLEASRPDEPVFDDNGGYLFRPAAYWYWYHSGGMRRMMRGQFAREIVPSLVASGAPMWIDDMRFEQLPGPVRGFVERHYQRYLGPIHLWGVRLPVPGENEAVPAIRDGRYFVAGAGGELPGLEVRVDGEPVGIDRPFELSRGFHRVAVRCGECRGDEDLFLLWLPAHGRPWVPGTGPELPYYPYFF